MRDTRRCPGLTSHLPVTIRRLRSCVMQSTKIVLVCTNLCSRPRLSTKLDQDYVNVKGRGGKINARSERYVRHLVAKRPVYLSHLFTIIIKQANSPIRNPG
ncbi:hypothetical protein RRG08_013360 [Elysia crispata]|uniref:Uncharacterized protein n=1 Tax=Elysia crispata TaxID=231223 RepID=A0AAE1AXY6_9GAST|nr:hypothetical protein RRG08_013360 [Elysia crispata]